MSHKEAILTRNEVENMIAEGRTIIIVDKKILKVDAWLRYHPGGDKAMMHMVGRDATDEVNAYVFSYRWYCGSHANHTKIALERSTESHAQVSDRKNRRALDQLSTTYPRRQILDTYRADGERESKRRSRNLKSG